ncbi:CrcB family protein [Halobacillus sp. BBL2006]|uniref:fluoride efflux transporter FluC n=1 Tax=Halobacillus sp. BBL2006 TaxID=1543706 RepID=UPI0006910379|nr:CrcB family protein [Halobacillus sp. BBL2006]
MLATQKGLGYMRKSLYLGIALGGGLGSCFRFGVSSLLTANEGGFPYGTLAVNLIGCMLLSFFYQILSSANGKAEVLHKALTTGFIGSFTTFSAFTAEFAQLYNETPSLASYYIFATVVGGLGMTIAGHLWGRRWKK